MMGRCPPCAKAEYEAYLKSKGSASKLGKNKQYRIEIKMPISKMPILGPLFGYKSKGGQIKRPKGVKIAQRGFGRAMKNGK